MLGYDPGSSISCRIAFVAVLSVCALAGSAHSANCSLRNPDRQILEMFPKATGYRAIITSVDEKAKKKIEKRLGSKLELSDLGRHVLYLALRDEFPIGFVHARTEPGERGGMELIWAMDLDLKVSDFRVQRARERYAEYIRTDSFREKLVGKGLSQLKRFFVFKGSEVNLDALELPAAAGPMAATVIQCGIKTCIITENAFGTVVTKARQLGNVHRFFPEAQRVRFVTSTKFDHASNQTIEDRAGSPPDQLDVASLRLLKAMKGKETNGVVVRSKWAAYKSKPELWWALSPNGDIRNVHVVGQVTSYDREQLEALGGKNLANLSVSKTDADTSPSKLALEVLTLVRKKME